MACDASSRDGAGGVEENKFESNPEWGKRATQGGPTPPHPTPNHANFGATGEPKTMQNIQNSVSKKMETRFCRNGTRNGAREPLKEVPHPRTPPQTMPISEPRRSRRKCKKKTQSSASKKQWKRCFAEAAPEMGLGSHDRRPHTPAPHPKPCQVRSHAGAENNAKHTK